MTGTLLCFGGAHTSHTHCPRTPVLVSDPKDLILLACSVSPVTAACLPMGMAWRTSLLRTGRKEEDSNNVVLPSAVGFARIHNTSVALL